MPAMRPTQEDLEIGRLIDASLRPDRTVSSNAERELARLQRPDEKYNDNVLKGVLLKAIRYMRSITGTDFGMPRVIGAHGEESMDLFGPHTLAAYDSGKDAILLNGDPADLGPTNFINTIFHEYFHYAQNKSYSVADALGKWRMRQTAYGEGGAEFFCQAYTSKDIRSKIERAAVIYAMMSGEEMESSVGFAISLNRSRDEGDFARNLRRIEKYGIGIGIDGVYSVSGPAIAMLLAIRNNLDVNATVNLMLTRPGNLFRLITDLPEEDVRTTLTRMLRMV